MNRMVCPRCLERSYTRSSHSLGIPNWDPGTFFVDLGTGEEHGPFVRQAEGAGEAVFLKIPADRCEIISRVLLGARYTGGPAWEDTAR